MKRARGFTLIEMMVVVAIVGIISAMGFAAYGRIGAQAAPQNAAHDFYSGLQKARSAALSRNAEVWVVIYPDFKFATSDTGMGAWAVLEDRTGGFAAGGALNYANFHPVTNPGPSPDVQVLDSRFMNGYPAGNAKFGTATGVAAAKYNPPFDALDALTDQAVRACSFCGGAGLNRRGAIIFEGNGSVRFVDDTGTTAPSPNTTARTAVGRSHSVGLADAKGTDRGYLFAISGPTGYIGFSQ